MLPDEGKISALVQCGSAGDYEDKAAVSYQKQVRYIRLQSLQWMIPTWTISIIMEKMFW